MKHILPLLAFVPVVELCAQPIITTADAPAIGEQFAYAGDGLYVTLPGGGSNDTWDFSGSGGTAGNTFIVVAASAAAGAAAFPGADVALATPGFEEFIGISTAGLEHMGQHTGTDNVVYSDPELYLPLPCQYGQTWDDDFAGSWGGGANTFQGNTIAFASGFGTLILPSGTLTNVLRIDLTQTRNESNGFTYVRTMNVFYRPGTGYLLASNERSELYISSTLLTTTEELTYLAGGNIGIMEPGQQAIGVQLMPVPAKDLVSVVFGGKGMMHLELFDTQGRSVLSTAMGVFVPGIHRYTLDVSGLPPAIYTVLLRNAIGEQGMQRLVVE